MTCIVGVEHSGRVYLGGDSAITSDATGASWLQRDPKVWKAGCCVVGFAGDSSFGEILKTVQWPARAPADCEAWARGELPKQLRAELQRRGLELSDVEGEGLIGLSGRLYVVEGDLTVVRMLENYAAIGDGGPPALGSLYTSASRKLLSPRFRLRVALEASERYRNSVRRPWRFVNT